MFVVSKHSNRHFALTSEHVIEVVSGYNASLVEAQQYARDYTKATDLPAYVYKVDMELICSYKIEKAVVHVPAKQK